MVESYAFGLMAFGLMAFTRGVRGRVVMTARSAAGDAVAKPAPKDPGAERELLLADLKGSRNVPGRGAGDEPLEFDTDR